MSEEKDLHPDFLSYINANQDQFYEVYTEQEQQDLLDDYQQHTEESPYLFGDYTTTGGVAEDWDDLPEINLQWEELPEDIQVWFNENYGTESQYYTTTNYTRCSRMD